LEINASFSLIADGITFVHCYELSFQNPKWFYIDNVTIFSFFFPCADFCAGSSVTIAELCLDQEVLDDG